MVWCQQEWIMHSWRQLRTSKLLAIDHLQWWCMRPCIPFYVTFGNISTCTKINTKWMSIHTKFIGLVTNDTEFVEAENMLLPGSGYVFCPGISVAAYRDVFKVLHYHSKEVHCILEAPFEWYEATYCLLWHKAAYQRTNLCHPRPIAMKFRVIRYKINGQCRRGICIMRVRYGGLGGMLPQENFGFLDHPRAFLVHSEGQKWGICILVT